MEIKKVKTEDINLLPELKLYLSINHDNDDELLEHLLDSTMSYIEDTTHTALRKSDVEFSHYNDKIFLPYLPLFRIDRVTKKSGADELILNNVGHKGELKDDSYKYIIGARGIEGIKVLNSGSDIIKIKYQAGFQDQTNGINQYKIMIFGCVKDLYHNFASNKPSNKILEKIASCMNRYIPRMNPFIF